MTTRPSRWTVWAVVCLAAACHRDPSSEARRFAERGDAYAARAQWKEAILEYGNAIKAKPDAAGVYYKRAKAYDEVGDAAGAYAAYTRAADLDASNIDAQLQSARLLLAAGDFDAARTRAMLAAKTAPDNVAAHIVAAQAWSGLNSTTEALREIEEARRLEPRSAAAAIALGQIHSRAGHVGDAQRAFDQAVELDPQAVDARLARAEFRLSTDDRAGAAADVEAALAAHPSDRAAHRAMALVDIALGRPADAESHLKVLADNDPGQLQLADYYLQLRRFAEARTIVDHLASSRNDAVAREARLRQAAASVAQDKTSEAYQILDGMIAEHPHRSEARLAKAKLLLRDGKADAADVEIAAVLKRDSGSADAHYLAALSAAARHDPRGAQKEFEEAIRINPRIVDAQAKLAQLELTRGDTLAAVDAARAAAALAPQDPALIVLLARALRARGDIAGARKVLVEQLRTTPGDPDVSSELGWIALIERRPADAAAAFNRALQQQPALPAALEGMTALDVAAGKSIDARERLQRLTATAPSDATVRVLLAKVDLADGRVDAAQRALEEVVASAPNAFDAYSTLGQIYAAKGLLTDAVRQYQALAERSDHPAAPLTMVGLLEESRQQPAAAAHAYEQALADDPESGTAANNLAWMYAEQGRLDEAERLARIALRILPQRPEPSDTLGWVLYRQGRYSAAAQQFQLALKAAPTRGMYQYHLGLALTKDGRPEGGAALRGALELGLSAADADAARAALLNDGAHRVR